MAYDFADAPMISLSDDDVWADEDTTPGAGVGHASNAEWARLEEEFTNAGYREGITTGKEAALQGGFDDGYASIGVPLGYELGLFRGRAAAFTTILQSSTDAHAPELLVEARAIASALADVRFSDIVPRDEEAVAHAREHGEEIGANQELQDKADAEMLEDMLGALSTAESRAKQTRPTMQDVQNLKARLDALGTKMGLPNMS